MTPEPVCISLSHWGLHEIPRQADVPQRRYRADHDEIDPWQQLRAHEARHGVAI
jgi:hypothetical protein